MRKTVILPPTSFPEWRDYAWDESVKIMFGLPTPEWEDFIEVTEHLLSGGVVVTGR